MKRCLMIAAILAMQTLTLRAGLTSTLLKTRASKSEDVTTGKWQSNFSKARSYAVNHKVPFVAVWSNGDGCGHCAAFTSSCNSSYFKTWMKKSGMVFYFTYSGESDGAVGGNIFHWIRKNKNTTYPFVRIYWPSGNVDVATIGDSMEKMKSGTTGGKKVVAYIKKKCAKFISKSTPVKPYTVVFQPNGGTGTMASKSTKVGTTFALPANAFKYTDYSFAGWAKTSTGSVAYKDKASVKNLTTVSNGVVNLYAKWTRQTFRTYYVGMKCTITMQSGLKGYTTSSKVPGLKWTSSKYKWTGTPTKAGTYTVKFKKGSKTVSRKIVVVKDSIVWGSGVGAMVFPTGKDISLDLSPTSAAGAFKSLTVTGLPAGLAYADGVISGSTALCGTFKLTFTAVSAAGQKLTRTYDLVIGVPACCIGTFNGFVGFVDDTHLDELSFFNRGTFRLSAPENASLSAKVVTAKGTYSMTGLGWRDNGDGTYTTDLKTSDGKNVVSMTVSGSTPPYDSIRKVGEFVPSYGTRYEVWAQRAPFARDAAGNYLDPVIGAAMSKVTGKWYFKCYAVGSQWAFTYATSKTANLTLTVAADGTAKLAGKVGSYAVSASSAVFIFAGDIENGYVRADFPVPVTVSKTKKTLDIWTNLWFDKSNSHFNARDEGIGGASVETFQ